MGRQNEATTSGRAGAAGPLLRTLRIRDLVLVDDLTVEFGAGLNLLTGETGAGKSILVDALGLIAGFRADRALVRSGAGRAVVEALIDVDEGLAAWSVERGLDAPEAGQLVVRREVPAEGTGRALLNGSPCTVAVLRELGERLFELRGQGQQRELLEADRQRELLDGFGGHEDRLVAVADAAAALGAARDGLDELSGAMAEREARLERLERVAREIAELRPRAGELDALEGERRRLQNAGRISELLERVVTQAFEGEPSASGLAALSARAAEELAALDSALADPARRLREASVELGDAGTVFRDYRERSDFDPAGLERLERRRAMLERACLEHGVDEGGLVELGADCERRVEALRRLDASLEAARERLAEAQARYAASAEALTAARRRAATRLARAVHEQLPTLALEKARFEVRLEPRDGCSAAGAERVELLLAANPGEPFAPVRRAASGGELSRVMLALHVAADREAPGRVIVFDEIDAGVGGAVADAVGARLKRLARRHQVLCVTHLPQVAAYGDAHYHVLKQVASGRTRTAVRTLSAHERVEELARMLGGSGPTASARRHASELLTAASRPRRRPQPRSRA